MNKIIKIIRTDTAYPEILRQIKDPPKELYCIGDISLLGKTAVAIVGSRRPSPYGSNVAFQLGKKLAAGGAVVVSGMAAGIDTKAHEGALVAEGKTVAVLGCGPDICYPKRNRYLKNSIEEKGLTVSEYPPGTEPMPYNFPRRNRIISGLSKATVVAEAGINSGSLITAEFAAQQGRDVYSVPCNITSVSGAGSNRLIKDGAMPLVVLDDILWDMGLKTKKREGVYEQMGKDEKRLYDLLSLNGEMTAGEICDGLMEPAEKVNVLITVMEMKGLVFTAMGRVSILVD